MSHDQANITNELRANLFLHLAPALVKLLQILTVLCLLGTNNEKASMEINDVLAQVMTNTETSKNANLGSLGYKLTHDCNCNCY